MPPSRLLKRLIRDSHSRELIRGSSLAMAFRLGGALMNYLLNFAIARLFGASVVGAFAIATTVVLVLGMLSRLGLDRAIVRFIAAGFARGNPDIAARQFWIGFWVIILLGSLFAAATFVMADLIAASVFGKPHLAMALRWVAPAVAGASLALYTAESLRGLKRIGEFAFLRYVLVPTLSVPLLFVFVQWIEPSLVPMASFLFATAITALTGLLLIARQLPTAAPLAKAGMVSMVAIALPMLLSNSMGMIISWTDILMLGRFVTEEQVGIYSITFKLAFVTAIVLNAVNSISTPKFAEMYAQGHLAELGSIMRQTTRLLFLTAVPVLLVLIILGQSLLGLFGVEFKAGYSALVILIVGQFISTISGPVGNLLQMTGNERVFLKIVAAAATANVVLNLVLIPSYGIVGAAIASAITLSANNVACVIVIRRKFGFLSVYVPSSVFDKPRVQ
jgi:O-antigen/teichoic acid export membrane protein